MNSNKKFLAAGVIFTVMAHCGTAQADTSCWSPAELRAYDVTMQTLMEAHVTADCDGIDGSGGSLRAEFAKFLSRNGEKLDADRAALTGYYKRAYGADWEMPLRQSLDREESRVNIQVQQNATPQFCAGAAKALTGLADQTWESFLDDASRQGWHEKAGLPKCE